MFCNAVQHAKAPGNAGIGTKRGLRRAPDRGDAPGRPAFRSRHPRTHAMMLLTFGHSVRVNPLRDGGGDPRPLTGSPPRTGMTAGEVIARRYVISLSADTPRWSDQTPQIGREELRRTRRAETADAAEKALAGLRVGRWPAHVSGARGDDDGLELGVRAELHHDVLDVPAGGVMAYH